MSPNASAQFIGDDERDVRAFAAEFPTPNVLRALALCESGRLPWFAVAELFARSTATALNEVRGE